MLILKLDYNSYYQGTYACTMNAAYPSPDLYAFVG